MRVGLVHLASDRKLHGVACNHVRRRSPHRKTTDRTLVTCRACLATR